MSLAYPGKGGAMGRDTFDVECALEPLPRRHRKGGPVTLRVLPLSFRRDRRDGAGVRSPERKPPCLEGDGRRDVQPWWGNRRPPAAATPSRSSPPRIACFPFFTSSRRRGKKGSPEENCGVSRSVLGAGRRSGAQSIRRHLRHGPCIARVHQAPCLDGYVRHGPCTHRRTRRRASMKGREEGGKDRANPAVQARRQRDRRGISGRGGDLENRGIQVW